MADDSKVEVHFSALTEDFNEGIDRAENAVQEFSAQIKSLASELSQIGESATAAGGKLSAALSDRQAARAATEDARGQIQAANAVYQNEMEQLNVAFAQHKITEQEKTSLTLAAINQREKAELDALNVEEAAANGNALTIERIENQKNAIIMRSINAREKAEDQAILKSVQEWKAAADQIASAFNSQLQKLLAGTEKWSQAMKNIAADLVLKMIEGQIKATAEFLAEKAREVAVSLAAEQSKSVAAEAGAALRSAAEVASGETSILAVIANAIKAIGASSGMTAAGVTANVAQEVGPAAPAVGAAAGEATDAISMGFVGATGAAIGGYVLSDGLAMIHAGESVVPAKMSQPYQGGPMGGGNSQVHLNISALDSRSIERFFNDNAKHMIRAINKGIKGGAHLGLRNARA
jgi:hypothetical protein